MTEHVGVSGSWKNITDQWVGVGGAWKRVYQKWVGVNGAWKLAWSAIFAPNVGASDSPAAPIVAGAAVGFYPNGTILSTRRGTVVSTAIWFYGDTPEAFDIYLSGTGNTPDGQPLNTWLNLASTKDWGLTSTGVAKSFSGTYQIRSAGGGDAIASGSLTLSADQQPENP